MPLHHLPVELFEQIIIQYMSNGAYIDVWRSRSVCQAFYNVITTEIFKQLPLCPVPRRRWNGPIGALRCRDTTIGAPGVPDALFVDLLMYRMGRPRDPQDVILGFIDMVGDEMLRVGDIPLSAREEVVATIIKCLVFNRPSSDFEWQSQDFIPGQAMTSQIGLAAAVAVGNDQAIQHYINSVGTDYSSSTDSRCGWCNERHDRYTDNSPTMGVIQNAAITGRDDLLRMCLQRARGFPTWNFGKLEAVLLDAVNGAIRAAQTEVINTLYEFWTNHWNPTKRYPFGTWLRLVAQCGSVETAQVVVPIAMAHGVSRYLLANEACKSNSADIIRYMLDKNLLSAESSLGSYTLRQAVVFGNREIARELIYRGANIKGSGLGASLTHTCFQRYNPSMLLFLIGWKCVLSPWTLRAAEREMSEMQIWPYPGRQNIQRKLCYYIIAKTRRTAAPSAWYIDCSELDAFTRRMDRDKGWKVLVEGLVKSWDSLKHPV